MTTLIAPVAGPILGGWISDNISWPWIFYVNIPVGVIAAIAAFAIFRERDSVIRKAPIDTVGLALLVIWIASLQIMLDKGKDLDWFNSTTIVVLTLIAVIALAFFIVWELTEAHPVIDLSLFKLRNFTGGTIALAVGYGLYFGNIVLLPLWLQTNLGYTATDAGLVLAPVGFFAVLLSPVVGKFLPRIDPRKIATGAFLVFALVLWMRSHYTTNVDSFTLMLPTLIQGIAMAGFFIPLVSLTLSGLPGHRIAAASGLSNFVRIMCGGIGTSIFSTAWDHRSSVHHAQLVEQANPYNPNFIASMEQFGAAGFSRDQSYGLFNSMATQQAAQLGVNDLFYISATIFVALIALIWITQPERSDGGDSAAAASAAH
nr:Multidrug export protein EmrB [Paraburkholderia busanensis]